MMSEMVRVVRYSKYVRTLPEVWVTIMSVVDEFDKPCIVVKPVAMLDTEGFGEPTDFTEAGIGHEDDEAEVVLGSDENGDWVHRYHVEVSGNTLVPPNRPLLLPRRALVEPEEESS